MRTNIRVILLDEIMLPGTGGDVGLDPAEASFLNASGQEGDIELPAVALACREPGKPVPTTLEQRASGSPGHVLNAAILGSGVLWPETAQEPTPRLSLEETTRVRLESITPVEGGWQANITPWPYERSGEESARALVERFYQALLVTRSEDEDGLREALEQPIQELESAGDDLARLLLLADYLFDSPHARRAVLEAPSAMAIQEMVGDALDLIGEGLPSGPRAVRPAFKAYLHAVSEEGLGQLQSTASVVTALAPLLKPAEKDLETLSTLMADIADVQARFDALVTRLVAGRKR